MIIDHIQQFSGLSNPTYRQIEWLEKMTKVVLHHMIKHEEFVARKALQLPFFNQKTSETHCELLSLPLNQMASFTHD